MYDKKLFCIRYIYNNMTISISLRFVYPNLDLWNVKISKQTNKQTYAFHLGERPSFIPI